MTKRNLVRRIADELNRSELETKPLVEETLDAITNIHAGVRSMFSGEYLW